MRDIATAPIYEHLRLTFPVLQALLVAGNRVMPMPAGLVECRIRHGAERVMPDGQTQTYAVTLRRPPAGLVECRIRHGAEQHRGLRLDVEPEYPGEWSAKSGAVAWHEHGQWVPCPSCGASLLWHEAGYVPGYRLCTRPSGGHHVQLASDGRSAVLVRR